MTQQREEVLVEPGIANNPETRNDLKERIGIP
jgi:hypothetical protein